jgi:hypothetical protein
MGPMPRRTLDDLLDNDPITLKEACDLVLKGAVTVRHLAR